MKGEKMKKTNGLRQKTHERVDKVMDQAESMGKSSKETMAHVKEKGVKMRGNIDGYIKKNPEKSAMFAAGAGVVAGAVTTAALMRNKHKD